MRSQSSVPDSKPAKIRDVRIRLDKKSKFNVYQTVERAYMKVGRGGGVYI